MRVTGGVLSGRKITPAPGVIRPAMDRMRESVFACLGDLSGASFLDLFSGTGVIALEAASRGAQMIEAVEKDPLKRAALLSNVKMSPVRIKCRFMAAELYIRRYTGEAFDVIFCDPPFNYRYSNDLATAIAASKAVKCGTRFLIHRPRGSGVDEGAALAAGFKLGDRREYGRSIVDFFTKS